MDRLFVDTSAWYAFANASDPEHRATVAAVVPWQGRLLTSTYVFDELITLVRYRIGHCQAVAIGRTLRDGACLLVDPEPGDLEEAWRVFSRRKDQRLSFTDCTSFVLMRRLELVNAAALDDDFRSEGFAVVP